MHPLLHVQVPASSEATAAARWSVMLPVAVLLLVAASQTMLLLLNCRPWQARSQQSKLQLLLLMITTPLLLLRH